MTDDLDMKLKINLEILLGTFSEFWQIQFNSIHTIFLGFTSHTLRLTLCLYYRHISESTLNFLDEHNF